ncbi:MAG TPA: hypothetical protein VK781_13080 [Solirubrobacteraceae bacterium]|nr:hypothetical protein [Solirubrobacteraceae bacterium]
MAEQRGEPVSRVAADLIRRGLDSLNAGHRRSATGNAGATIEQPGVRRAPGERAPWLMSYPDDPQWRTQMWAAIVALHERYPRQLERLKDDWWESAAHVEMLCAFTIWRDWIDHYATDPRDELRFHIELHSYGELLRSEGGSWQTWTPGAPPEHWAY